MKTGLYRLVLIGALSVPGCGPGATDTTDPEAGARISAFVPQQDVTLAKQFFSGMTARERTVIRSASQWPAVWARIHGAVQPPPGVVQPDFASEMAVVAALGQKPTGGFEIVIDSVTQYERGSIVYVTERKPGSSCITTVALTQPVHAVRAPRTDGSIWWRERSVTENC